MHHVVDIKANYVPIKKPTQKAPLRAKCGIILDERSRFCSSTWAIILVVGSQYCHCQVDILECNNFRILTQR